MVLTYFYTKEEIFNAVKAESSVFAERQVFTDKNGNSTDMFDKYVFDEQHKHGIFTKYWNEAQTDVMLSMAAHITSSAVPALYDSEDGASTERFVLQLRNSGNFQFAMNSAVDNTIKSYMVNYIMYLWLRTKDPNSAQIYLSETKSQLQKIFILLNKREHHESREGQWY